jgi:hypothetical protein
MESSLSRKIIVAICLLQAFSCFAGKLVCKPPSQIETGDLVYRYQDSMISNIVLRVQGDQRFSHVGIAVRMKQDLFIVHSEYDPSRNMDGVVWEAYCDYVQLAQRVSVKRQSLKPALSSDQVISEIKNVGNKKFNLTLTNKSSNTVYCTQFVWLIFSKLYKEDVFKLKNYPENVITVRDLYQAENFTTMYDYH